MSVKSTRSVYSDLLKNDIALLNTATKGASRYKKQANNFKLSKNLKSKVKNGTIDITKYSSDTQRKITDYQNWWDKYKNEKEQINETKRSMDEYATSLANVRWDKASKDVEKYQDKLSLLKTKYDNLTTVKSKSKNLDNQAKEQKNELKTYEKAVTSTEKDKASILKKISKKNKQKKDYNSDGTLKTKGLSGKQLEYAKQYNSYVRQLADNQTELNQKTEEYKSFLLEIEKTKFDNIHTFFERQLDSINNLESSVSSEIDIIESKGATVSAKYYKDSINYENQKLSSYEKEKAALQEQLANISVGTDAWYDAQSAIVDVDNSIAGCNSSIVDMNNKITDLADTMHNKLLGNIQKVSDEMDFFAGLVSSKDLTDKDSGNLTDEGLLTLGSYVTGYNAIFIKAQETKELLDEMKSNYENGVLSYTDVEGNERSYQSAEQMKNKIDELYSDWREQITTTNEYEQKAIDLISEKYNSELDYLKELIDKKKDALQAEKDLYEYQKQIADKAKNITTIQKQIVALSGDSSEESSSKIQKLQSKLDDAQSDLKDAQYDKMIGDQSDMLDKLYDEYEDLMNGLMKDTNKLIQDAIDATNSNQTAINNMKDALCDKYDYVQDTTAKLFDNSGVAVTNLDAIKNAFDLSQSGLYGAAINSGVASIVQAINGISIGANTTAQQSSSSSTPTYAQPTNAPVITEEDPNIAKQQENNELLKRENLTAMNYMNAHVTKAKKKRSEYSDVNKKIFDLSNGKILSTDELKTLAGKLGVQYDNASSSGKLYKKLKEIGISGFRTGGIAKIKSGILSSGEDGITLARNGEGFVSPEDVPAIQNLLKNIPTLTNVATNFAKLNIPDYSSMIKEAKSNSTNIGDVTVVVDGSSVTDVDSFVGALGNPKVQKAVQSVTTDLLTSKGNRLGINKYRNY